MRTRDLVGRTIVAVDLRRFADARGGWAFDPVITLDNGRRLAFSVQETDTGEYGVELLLSAPVKRPVAPRRARRAAAAPTTQGGPGEHTQGQRGEGGGR